MPKFNIRAADLELEAERDMEQEQIAFVANRNEAKERRAYLRDLDRTNGRKHGGRK